MQPQTLEAKIVWAIFDIAFIGFVVWMIFIKPRNYRKAREIEDNRPVI